MSLAHSKLRVLSSPHLKAHDLRDVETLFEKQTNMHRLLHKSYVGNLQVFLIIQDSDLFAAISL